MSKRKRTRRSLLLNTDVLSHAAAFLSVSEAALAKRVNKQFSEAIQLDMTVRARMKIRSKQQLEQCTRFMDQHPSWSVLFVHLMGIKARDVLPFAPRLLMTHLSWSGSVDWGVSGSCLFRNQYVTHIVMSDLKTGSSLDFSECPKLCSLALGPWPSPGIRAFPPSLQILQAQVTPLFPVMAEDLPPLRELALFASSRREPRDNNMYIWTQILPAIRTSLLFLQLWIGRYRSAVDLARVEFPVLKGFSTDSTRVFLPILPSGRLKHMAIPIPSPALVARRDSLLIIDTLELTISEQQEEEEKDLVKRWIGPHVQVKRLQIYITNFAQSHNP